MSEQAWPEEHVEAVARAIQAVGDTPEWEDLPSAVQGMELARAEAALTAARRYIPAPEEELACECCGKPLGANLCAGCRAALLHAIADRKPSEEGRLRAALVEIAGAPYEDIIGEAGDLTVADRLRATARAALQPPREEEGNALGD